MDEHVWPEAGAEGLTLTGTDADPVSFDAGATETDDAVHDEIAEIFMGPADAAGPQPSAASSRIGTTPSGAGGPARGRGRARIEALLLGHLPVRASLWVRQYAARLADRSDGAVGLVRLGRGGANIERHRGPGSGETEPFAWWVVRVDEVDQPSLIRASGDGDAETGRGIGGPGIDRITVLTGADDASVIACYRLLKGVAADLDRRLGDGEGPDLAVAIAGADAERADLAVRRLRDATGRFLGRDLMEGPRVPRAGTTNATVLGRWEGSTSVEDLVGTIRGGSVFWADADRSGDVEPTRTELEPSAPAFDRAPAAEPALSAQTQAAPIGADASDPVDPVELIGELTTVDITCPAAPEVRFARDERGRLHAVTRFGREGLDAALAASAWARAHAALLRRVEPELSPSLATEGCVIHVLGGDARELRALGESDVRTHLLRRVPTRHGDVWVCDPLN